VRNLAKNGSAMGILLLGGLALHAFNRIKETPRALVPGMGLLPTVGLAVHDFLKDVDLPDLDDSLTGYSGSDYGSDFILNGGHEQGLAEAGGIGGLGAQGIIDQQRGLSGILDHGLIKDITPQPPKKRRKTVYRNLFEDEDPAIGPMADHPVEKDPGEDTHGFAPSPVADTTYQITGLGMFGDEDPGLGNYVEPVPPPVQTQPREIASTNIPFISYGMFEEDQFNW
jgi:hypothetical protein